MIPSRQVFFDGYPVDTQGLSTSSVANLGYDQLRAVTSHRSLAALPWTVTLGSVVTVVDTTDQVTWQGRLSATPTIEADQTVRLAAQGHAYEAAKSGRRLPVKVTQVEGWNIANIAPLDFPQTASTQPTIAYSASGTLARNRFAMSFTSATDVSVAYYAAGAEIRRLQFSGFTFSGSPTVQVWGAVGPGIAASKILVKTLTATEISLGTITVDFPAQGFDCVVVNLIYSGATSGNLTVTDPIIWGAQLLGGLQSHDIARAIGDMLRWDTSGIGEVGGVTFPSFDWAGDVAGGLSEATVPDDFRWLVLDDRGNGPVLDFGDWGRTWEVSAASGARWQLDPLEKYTKIIVQYLDTLNKANAVTVESTEPFLVTNELRTVAGGLQSVDDPSGLPEAMAANILDYASSQRWRGTVTASQVYEAGTGLGDLYRVRAGDVVRITDFSPTDGSVTLRISEITQEDGGITMGIAAPSFPGGSLGGGRAGPTAGTFIQTDDAYAPTGSPGSVIPAGNNPYTGPQPDLGPAPKPPKF